MSIISDLISGGLAGILQPIASMFNKKEDVTLEKFKIDGKVDIALVQANVSIVQAQSALLQNKIIVWLQVSFGAPLAIYYAKCILWDKVLALGSTDPLTGDIATYSLWIMGFLFLHSAVTSWTRKT